MEPPESAACVYPLRHAASAPARSPWPSSAPGGRPTNAELFRAWRLAVCRSAERRAAAAPQRLNLSFPAAAAIGHSEASSSTALSALGAGLLPGGWHTAPPGATTAIASWRRGRRWRPPLLRSGLSLGSAWVQREASGGFSAPGITGDLETYLSWPRCMIRTLIRCHALPRPAAGNRNPSSQLWLPSRCSSFVRPMLPGIRSRLLATAAQALPLLLVACPLRAAPRRAGRDGASSHAEA